MNRTDKYGLPPSQKGRLPPLLFHSVNADGRLAISSDGTGRGERTWVIAFRRKRRRDTRNWQTDTAEKDTRDGKTSQSESDRYMRDILLEAEGGSSKGLNAKSERDCSNELNVLRLRPIIWFP